MECLKTQELPLHEGASGLISISVFQRPLGSMVEVMISSVWRSERDLMHFDHCRALQDGPPQPCDGIITLAPRMFEVVLSLQGGFNTTTNPND